MSQNFQESVNFTEQVIIGSDPFSVAACGFGAGPLRLDGATAIKGPVIIGSKATFVSPGVPRGNLMITKRPPTDVVGLAAEALPLSIVEIENSLIGGVIATPLDILIGAVSPCGVTINSGLGGVNIFSGPSTIKRMGPEGENTIAILRNYISSLIEDIGAKIFAGFKTELGVDVNLALALNSAPQINKTTNNAVDHVAATATVNLLQATKKDKPFDITHPNKKGWRLRHVCIEGPEIAVYCRGKVGQDGVIDLPSFWEGFVNTDDMTINLTAIGSWQELFVKEVQWGKKVIVRNNAGGSINADYHITARRLDDDLIVEYEGESCNDYPGVDGKGNEGYEFSWENDNMERIVKEVAREKLNKMEKK
tara:strand:- start:10433 stop:11527 length:1095 start_codon:yes stop_codon:yes gene_type:complete